MLTKALPSTYADDTVSEAPGSPVIGAAPNRLASRDVNRPPRRHFQLSAASAGPLRGCRLVVQSELAGREPHRKIERALRRHCRVFECDLYRQPVEQGGQRDREIVRVHGRELAGLLD